METTKPHFTPEYQEFEARDAGYEKRVRVARGIESFLLLLCVVSCLAGISIVGVAGHTLSVYNTTHLGQDFLLPLWPSDFDIRPTIALISCGAIVLITSTLSLIISKLPPIRNNPLIHASVSFLIPSIKLTAALIGMSFYYGVNSSHTVYSLQAWSCQWSSVDMNIKPYWGTLCKESKAGLYLMVMIIPLEVLVLGTTTWAAFTMKKQLIVRERKGSPAMS